jgi:hypothetical protein
VKTFELINTQINSKLGVYTHWVHQKENVELKSRQWRPLNCLVLKSIQSSGATPGAPNGHMGQKENVELKSRQWRPLSWLVLKSIQSLGAHPLGAPNGYNNKAKRTSKA